MQVVCVPDVRLVFKERSTQCLKRIVYSFGAISIPYDHGIRCCQLSHRLSRGDDMLEVDRNQHFRYTWTTTKRQNGVVWGYLRNELQ
jgi:hypothetical protein